MANSRGMSVFVNIGANVLGSVNSSARTVENRMMAMTRRFKAASLESTMAIKRFTGAYGGLLSMATAGGVGFGLVKAIGAGADYDHELQALRNAGRTTTQVAQAIAAANRTIAELPTSTLAGNLALINETTTAFGDYGHAVANVGRNQKIAFLLANSAGEPGGDPEAQTRQLGSLVRMLEMRGAANDQGRYTRETDMAFRAMMATRGRVGGDEFRAFGSTGNPIIKTLSTDYLYRYLPSLMQEYGADQAGTMHQALANTILGKVGMGGKAYAQEWGRLGLLDPAIARRAKNGSVTGWQAGAIAGTSTFLQNPYAWAGQYLLPALQKAGVNVNDQVATQVELSKLVGKNTAARLLGSLINTNDRTRMAKDAAFTDQTPGIDAAYADTLRNDPKAAAAALKSSVGNLMAALTGGQVRSIGGALTAVAGGINKVAAAIAAHPGITRAVVGLTGAFAGLSFAASGLKAGRAVVVKFFAHLGKGGIAVAQAGVRGLTAGFVGLRNAAIGASALTMAGGWKALGASMLSAVTPTRLLGLAMKGLALSGPMLIITAIVAALAFLINKGRNIGSFFTAMGSAILKTSPGLKPLAEGIGKVAHWFADLASPISIAAWTRWGTAVGDAIGGVVNWVAKLVTGTGDLISNLGHLLHLRGGSAPAPAGTPAPQHRAAGGPVSAGHLYAVNENGEELFVPGRSGTIIPARATAALLAAMAGGAPMAAAAQPIAVNASIVIQDSRDPARTAREVERALVKLARAQTTYLSD